VHNNLLGERIEEISIGVLPMIGGKLSTQREKPAHLVGQLPGLFRGALHALVFLLVFSSARFALHLIGLVVSDEFPIRFSMAFFSGSTISSSTSSLRIAWVIKQRTDWFFHLLISYNLMERMT
jgi:hypothetical protein